MKVLRMYAENIGYKCTLKEEEPSKTPGGFQRQRLHHSEKESDLYIQVLWGGMWWGVY